MRRYCLGIVGTTLAALALSGCGEDPGIEQGSAPFKGTSTEPLNKLSNEMKKKQEQAKKTEDEKSAPDAKSKPAPDAKPVPDTKAAPPETKPADAKPAPDTKKSAPAVKGG